MAEHFESAKYHDPVVRTLIPLLFKLFDCLTLSPVEGFETDYKVSERTRFKYDANADTRILVLNQTIPDHAMVFERAV